MDKRTNIYAAGYTKCAKQGVKHLSNRVYTKAGEMYSIAVCIKNIVYNLSFLTIYKEYIKICIDQHTHWHPLCHFP